METFIELANADCLDYMAHMPDQCVDMILCDLPYGTTKNKWDSIIPLDSLWQEYKRICKSIIVLTATQPFSSQLVLSNKEMFSYELIWRKSRPTGHLNANKAPLRAHEVVLIFYNEQPIYNPQKTPGKPYKAKSGRATTNYGAQVVTETINLGDRYPVSVLDFPSVSKTVHPTQKPVELMEYLIKTYTNEGMLVLDNCMGSGTTGVACKKLNRSFIGIEKDPEYFKLAERRINETV